MDPVSTTASFLTILGVLVKSAEAAQEIWGSPDELQRLATDLSELSELVNRLNALTRRRAIRDDDLRSLKAPYAKLREAQKVFEERLSKRHSSNNPASRFRRRTWILHRARIRKVTKDVATVRAQLSILLQSFTFSSVLGIRTIQDQQSHALTLVDGRVFQCQNLLHSLAQYQKSSTHEQTALGPRLTGTIEESASNRETYDLQGEAADIEDFLDCVSHFSDSISEVIQFYTPSASLLDCPIATSSACYPEDYVIEGLLYARIACFSMIELRNTATTRIEKYYLLFAQGGRLWRRVTITATTTTTSRDWDAAFSFTETCYHVFPYLKESRLERILEQTSLYESVTNLSLQFQLTETGDVTFDEERRCVAEELEDTSATYASKYMQEVEQRGIQQYVETQVLVFSKIRTAVHLVLVDNQPCIQRSFPFLGSRTSDKHLVIEFIAELRLLQMTQGCSGVAELVGVVVNDKRSQLCSYLVRYPEAGLFGSLLDTSMSNGKPFPWTRREQWIRQLMVAVAEIHKRGALVGCVDKESIWLDLDDRIRIVLLKSMGSYRRNQHGYLPPEVRGGTAFRTLATGQSSTVESDLFQLGLLVWMLAENAIDHGKRAEIHCRKSGCQSLYPFQCREDHANPINLPLCGTEVPGYINEIVRHCRQSLPSRRKSASALLDLLPANPDQPLFSPERVPPHRPYCQGTHCSQCGHNASHEHYNCRICDDGDFDLCVQCFSQPSSCSDAGHKMIRQVAKNGLLIEEELSLR